jgi:hypothetical protein
MNLTIKSELIMNDLAVTHYQALEVLEKQKTPEAMAILDYVKGIKEKNIAVLGTDEAFVLQDNEGQIKAFKKALTLSQQDGTLIQPTHNGPFVVSAQGYEVWAESTGTSVIFPKEVLVGNEWRPNPYAERDEKNRRILAVHARAIAFRYSSMGIPQISDWTTIFDTPSYRMIDLLAKAKQCPQAFKVLPGEMKPDVKNNETWATYPFDESMNLWINTSHDEVIKWLSQILNREKKAMDFAQTFAKRNALKHLSGIQKAPANQWRFPVLAWRPTGDNVVKWDAAQYANLQDRVAGMIEGGGSDEFTKKIELKQGTEKTSEEEGFEGLEAEIDPEDSQESEEKPATHETSQSINKPPKEAAEPTKDVKQLIYLSENFPSEFSEACKILDIDTAIPVNLYEDKTAIKLCQKIGELVDQQN